MPSPDPIWLQDDVHFAWTGADVVTLDLRTDAYGLMTDAVALVRQGPGRQVLVKDAAAVESLLSADLVSLTCPQKTLTLSAPRPKAALLPGEGGDDGIALRLAAGLGALLATARFRRSTLPDLLQGAGRSDRLRRPPIPLAKAYAAFDAVLPWIPLEGQCLQRAFMLRRHLVHCGHPAQWIIGVRTWPFLAHAWVQVGACVVGDSLERVTTFTPILVD